MNLDTLITEADPAIGAALDDPDSPGAIRLYQSIVRAPAVRPGWLRTGRAAGRPFHGRRLARAATVTATLAALTAGALVTIPGLSPGPAAPPPAAGPPGLLLAAARVTPPPARAAAAGMPPLYVTLSSATAVIQVRDSATGAIRSAAPLPRWADPKLTRISAGPGGRLFVLALGSARGTLFYRLTVTPGGQAGPLNRLGLAALPPGQTADAIALSPDGSRLAVAIQLAGPVAHGAVAVLSLASGQRSTWSTPRPGEPWALSWAASGAILAVNWADGGPSGGSPRASRSGLWLIDPAAPGGSLLAGRRVTPSSVGGDDLQSAVLAPDGRTVLAAVTYDGQLTHVGRDTVVGGVAELSARTGRPLRTLLTEHAAYSPDQGWHVTPCQLIDSDPTGRHLLVSCDGFGRLDRGRFTPLPGLAPQQGAIAAW